MHPPIEAKNNPAPNTKYHPQPLTIKPCFNYLF